MRGAVPLAAAVVEVEDGHAGEAGFGAEGLAHVEAELPVGAFEVVDFVVLDLVEAFAFDDLAEADGDALHLPLPVFAGVFQEFVTAFPRFEVTE